MMLPTLSSQDTSLTFFFIVHKHNVFVFWLIRNIKEMQTPFQLLNFLEKKQKPHILIMPMALWG